MPDSCMQEGIQRSRAARMDFVEDPILILRRSEEVRGAEMWRVSDGCRFQS